MRTTLVSRRRGASLPVVLAVAALLATACGGETGDGRTEGADASAALGPANAATGEPAKIGWVSTGQTQSIDTTDEIRAAQAVAAYANAHLGGLGGHPIELFPCEDKSIPAEAQACGNQFLTEQVAAVAAGSPGQTDPWIELIRPAGIPAVFNVASTPMVLETDGVFVLGNPLGAFGTAAAYARQNGLHRAAALVIDVPAASGAARLLLPPLFANADATVDVIAIPPGAPDMTPQVQVAQNANPQMYHVIGDPAFCSSAIRAIRTLGIDTPITALDRCIGADGGASIPGGWEGVEIVAQANVDPADPEFQLFSAVVEEYGDGLEISSDAVSGYQGMLGFVRAFNAAGSTDVTSAGVIAALREMPPTPYPLGGGATFQCNGQAAATVSQNICGVAGFLAGAAADGTLSNFRTVDASGLYDLSAG